MIQNQNTVNGVPSLRKRGENEILTPYLIVINLPQDNPCNQTF